MRRLLFVLFMLVPMLVSAQSNPVKIGGIFYNLDSGTRSATVTSGDVNYSGVVVIPSSVTFNGITYTVTSIGEYAFENCKDLTSVTIGNSVTSIEKFAFDTCTGLTSVTIPNSVTSIGRGAFMDCSGLTSVTIGNSVTSIEKFAFNKCTGLTSVTIPNSVTNIESRAFLRCSNLTSVSLPSSLINISHDSFMECNSLTSIKVDARNTKYDSRNDCNAIIETSTNTLILGCKSTSIPNSVTSIGDRAFYYSNINSITIPNSVTSIGEGAFYHCSSLTAVTIDNSVKRIDDIAFYDCLALNTITSYIDEPFSISQSVFSDETYRYATLNVPIYSLESYKTAEGWKRFNNIEIFYAGTSLTLTVVDSKNNDISKEVNVIWYNSDGKQLGTGQTLNGLIEGSTVYYSVILNEELGRKYREVNMRKVVVGSESITCQLEEIDRLMLTGRVSATDIDKVPVAVNVQQMLNGKYEQDYSTVTDEQGTFKVEVYDDQTDITISGDGYFGATLHKDGFGGNGNVGTIPLSLISGVSFAADITLKKAVAEGGDDGVVDWAEGLHNIDFSLYNMTKGQELTDFTVQNGNVIIKTGANVGDNIRLAAKSKQNIFVDATTTFSVEEGANSFLLELTELGGVDITFASSNNGTTVGYLYNSNGILVSKGSYAGEKLSLRHLPSGSYTLISMGSTTLLGNLTSLSDVKSVGLSEGGDYVALRIEVADGVLTESYITEVPRMNESRFYYTNNDTYFSSDKASVISGNYLSLSAHLDFKPEYANSVNAVKLTFDLPEGCQLVENSVIANRNHVAYTIDGSKLTMNVGKEQWQDKIRFCIIPVQNKTYALTAIASFDIDGNITQPIGTSQFESKGLSLNMPSKTADTRVVINGTAKSKSEVSIYDNDVLIGKTTSKADGTWTTTCELYKPYSHSFHDIYAKIITDNGMELTSETKQVEYGNLIVPKTVSMLYYNPEYVGDYNIVFDLINGTTNPSSYYYFPYKNWPNWYETRETEPKDFTFLADFTKNDSTVIKNVIIEVLNSDGTVRSLPAMFDGKQGKWVATTKYSSSSRLPQKVNVEYDLFEAEFDNTDALEDQTQILSDCAQAFYNYSNEHYDLEYISEDANTVTLNLIDTGTTLGKATITELDYQETVRYFDSVNFDYYVDEEGKSYCYFIDSSESTLTLSIIDLADNIAYKITFDFSDKNLRKAKGLDVFFELCDAVDMVDTFKGFLDTAVPYLNIKSDLDNMYELCKSYNWNLSEIHDATLNRLKVRCSDGSLRLPEGVINQCLAEIAQLEKGDEDFIEKLYEYIDIYKRKIANSAVFDAAITAIGLKGPALLAKSLNPRTKIIASLTKQLNGVSSNTVSKFMTTYLGYEFGNALNNVTETIQRVSDFGDFHGEYEKFSRWAPTNYNIRINKYIAMQDDIELNYKDCDNEDKDKPSDDDKSKFNGKGSTPKIDPSGYVYEAVLSNRLEGVTATCYQKVQSEDMYGDMSEEAVLWNAEDYSQQNPLKTDKDGFYRWDVPQGMWQVKYEKEGYETAYSEWLPVPPPQLDVNVGMKQSTPPSVKQMRGTESGITIDMTKYMLPASMNVTNITMTRNGKAEHGKIEMLNAEQAPLSGETYVQKVKFIPDTRFKVSDNVEVTVRKNVESYCGVNMLADHRETVKIEAEITGIEVAENVQVPYQGELNVRVSVMPKEASAGRTLHVNTSSSMIASVNAKDFTIEQDGSVTLIVGGELPGGAVLDFAVEGSDVSASSKVQVKMIDDLISLPYASIPSGEVVAKGTLVELSCNTEGAVIYYTLDGTCPCDENHRILYTKPIAINESVTIKAIAVVPGMYESDVVEFHYILDATGISEITFDDALNLYPLPMKDVINVKLKDKMVNQVIMSDPNGTVMTQSSGHSNMVSLDVHSLPAGVYVISVYTDGNVFNRKVVKIE